MNSTSQYYLKKATFSIIIAIVLTILLTILYFYLINILIGVWLILFIAGICVPYFIEVGFTISYIAIYFRKKRNERIAYIMD